MTPADLCDWANLFGYPACLLQCSAEVSELDHDQLCWVIQVSLAHGTVARPLPTPSSCSFYAALYANPMLKKHLDNLAF